MPESADPFGTAAIRRAVLAGWTAAPARFREDANAEEDYALGGYRDRLVVELAQNAADAATLAGQPGRLRLQLDGAVLRAANVGAPLDAAGVQALATLRASAKRTGGTVGRFGVGFAAVLAVTDAPQINSVGGGVRFDRTATAAAVADVPELAAELARRRGRVPTLRLPWPVDDPPPSGFATEVVLPLRAEAVAAVGAMLDAVAVELLLGLPELAQLQIGDRVLSARWHEDGVELRDGAQVRDWRVHRGAGRIPDHALVGRPTEEQEQDRFAVTWALPLDRSGAPIPTTSVLHAPTPSEEPVSVPARLIATVPLDPDRRHVATGPLADFVLAAAADTYAELVAAFPDRLDLVPRPQLAAAAFDAALVTAVLDRLRRTPFLSTVDDERVSPTAATLVEGVDPVPFGSVLAGLLQRSRWDPALGQLGVRRLGVAELVELLSTVDRPATWWRGVYAALADADRDALAGLPVPLADGRVVTGPRGLVLADPQVPAAALGALGLRVVDPAAAHPLLERLGARPASPRVLLADDAVRALVEGSLDAEDPEPLAWAVLDLAGAAGVAPGELPWLAELALPGDDGEWYPAGELVLPESPLAAVVAADAPFGRPDPALLRRFGPEVLTAVGVLDRFAVVRQSDVDTGDADLQLDGETDWYAALADRLPPGDRPPVLPTVVAARDLELVDPAAWPAALELLTDPALHEPVVVDGLSVPSYTRWWLSTHPVLAGHRPDRLRRPAAVDLTGLYDPCAHERAALAGARGGLGEVLADPAALPDLLDRLADPARTVPVAVLATIYARIADTEVDLDPPAGVRVAPDRVVAAERVVVLDAPHLLPLLDRPCVPGGARPADIADLLDLPLAAELVGAPPVDSTPVRRTRWAELPGVELAAARCAGPPPDAAVYVHNGLTVGGVAVPWWPEPTADHVDAAAGAAALGRALAWRLGRWDRRTAAAEALADPDRLVELIAEDGCG